MHKIPKIPLPTLFAGFHEAGDYEHVCTGAILSSNIIITAAHCFADSRYDK